jgi:hypothetical protein
MSEGDVPLLDIPRPCSIEWSSMSGEGIARTCGRCQRAVHDFSLLSTSQIQALMNGSSQWSADRAGFCTRITCGEGRGDRAMSQSYKVNILKTESRRPEIPAAKNGSLDCDFRSGIHSARASQHAWHRNPLIVRALCDLRGCDEERFSTAVPDEPPHSRLPMAPEVNRTIMPL